MIPLSDDNPSHHRPIVTIVFIAINVAVFLWQITGGPVENARKVFAYSTVPYNVTHDDTEAVTRIGRRQEFGTLPVGTDLAEDPDIVRQPVPSWVTLFTSMFMHGGWMHLIGNMLFLWIFGSNIEDATGKIRFVFFYLVSGLAAALIHVYSDPESIIPTLGASGAVSGVLGGYLLLYPKARIYTLVTLPYFFTTTMLPAMVFLPIWFGLQVLSAFRGGGGVAWYAHIGGFVVGLALIKLAESAEHRSRPRHHPMTTRFAPRRPRGGPWGR